MRAHVTGAAPTAMRWLCGLSLAFLLIVAAAETAFGLPAPAPAQTRSSAGVAERESPAYGNVKMRRALDRAREKMRRGDYKGAMVELEKAMRMSPHSLAAGRLLRVARFERRYQKGVQDEKRGRLGAAETDFRQALAFAVRSGLPAQANRAGLRLALVTGARLLQDHAYEAAAESYSRALGLSPSNREAAAGLTEARFRAAFRAGQSALAGGAFSRARERFRECLEYKPASPEVLREISRMNEIEKEANQFQSEFQTANAFIDAGAWNQADAEIRKLAAIMEQAELSKIHSPAIFASRPLLAAYVSYADGDFSGAFRLAGTVRGRKESERAAKFRRFLQLKSRSYYLAVWGPALLGAYALTLILGLYAGLKTIGRVPAPAATKPRGAR